MNLTLRKYICIFLIIQLALEDSLLCTWKKYCSTTPYVCKFLRIKEIRVLNTCENSIENFTERLILGVTLLLNSGGKVRVGIETSTHFLERVLNNLAL